jgi:hypothetical protein
MGDHVGRVRPPGIAIGYIFQIAEDQLSAKLLKFLKKCMVDYLRVGLHEYHNENPNGDFRFLRSCDSYRIWHLKKRVNTFHTKF